MGEHKGILFGWAETGTEGLIPALQEFEHISEDGQSWSYAGLVTVEPGDKLTIYKDDEEVLTVKLRAIYSYDLSGEEKNLYEGKRENYFAKWLPYPDDTENGQLCFNGWWTHWLPKNVDLGLWWDVFYDYPHRYTGKLNKK